MKGSSATTDPRSNTTNPTLDCFTGAVLLREAAGEVCSTYRRSSAPFTATPPVRMPVTLTPCTLTPTSLATPTSLSAPPPVLVRRPGSPATRPLVIVRQRAANAREALRPLRALHPRLRARPLPWSFVGAFAVGATLAALLGTVTVDAPLHIAIFACALAGVVTAEAWLDRRRHGKARAARLLAYRD